jgi:hypothetical protein
MFRFALAAMAAICLLLVPAATSAAWTSSPGGGSSTVVTSVGRGQCVYERQTTTGQGSFLQLPIAPTNVSLNCNTEGTEEGDVAIEVRRCDAGTAAYSANVCHTTDFKNAAGVMVQAIDGDVSNGTDAVYEVRAPVVILNTTTHPAAGRISQVRLCVDAE